MFVEFHVNALAPEGYPLRLQPETLFEGVFSLKLDGASGSDNALPGDAVRSVQNSGSLASPVRNARCARDCTVGTNFAARDFGNLGEHVDSDVGPRFF